MAKSASALALRGPEVDAFVAFFQVADNGELIPA
jgi:hypothetical protein